jgi:NAD(P)-dependent dehydrogenase (short-subunit alcohol dehydrogenase family)
MLLAEKVVVLTGIGPGLGREIALLFAREGASLVIGARTEGRLEEVRAEIDGAGGKVVAVPTDITDRTHCDRIVQTAVDTFGGLDVVVQNGFAPDVFQPFESVDLDHWRRIMDVNLWGSLQLAQAAIPALKARGGGSIVFVNSMIIRKPLPLQGGYATSKGALMTAAQVLARELGPYRIRVNSLVPGWMLGPSVEGYFRMTEAQTGRSYDEQYSEIASQIALGVIPPDDECARAALFLASDLSSMVTGESVDVNGGEVFH